MVVRRISAAHAAYLMSSLLLLIGCLLLGMSVARWGRPPETLAGSLNWWVLNVALPALVLEIIPRLEFNWALWFLPAALWLVFAVDWMLFDYLGRQLHWSRGTRGALILTTGLCNTSFVGYPLIEALRGKEALQYAAVADQLGTFLAVTVGGSLVAAIYSGRSPSAYGIARKTLLFPPFMATLAALLIHLAGGWPVIVDEVLSRIGSTLTPLALFAVGLQLRLRLSPGHSPALILGLAWKLILAPLMIYALARAMGITGPVFTISVLQTAMAPMVSAAILADQHDLDPPLANMILGLGIFVSLLTVSAWNALL